MRTLLLSLVLIGCGSSNNTTADAPPGDTGGSGSDAATVALDCPTYCNTIMANCTGATNAQYPDMNHCLGSCAAFPVTGSKVTDTTGNTLGCRIYHSGAAGGSTANATLHCPHAGPGGEALNASPPGFCSGPSTGGDLCATFCTLQIKTCGSTDAPVTVAGTAIVPQYKNEAACEAVCKNGDNTANPPIAKFDLTHLYATTSAGNSLACRIAHWTNAASNAGLATPNAAGVNTHCPHTAAAQTAGLPCSAATPTP
jgi:hypothetical protein